MNPSIKRFLLISITCAILLVYALISATAYWVSQEELNELYDANLQQVADTIAIQNLAMPNASGFHTTPLIGMDKKIRGEEAFYVRISAQDGRVLYESHPDLLIPNTSQLGLSTLRYHGSAWRLFATEANGKKIQVAQSLRLRKNTIKETAVILMIAQLIFIPILVLLIFLAIKKALYPLLALSRQITLRQSTDLHPFVLESLPSEIKPLVASLNQFMAKVSNMVSMLSRFTADAAHELRTPITALKLQVSVLEHAETEAARMSALKQLKSGIYRSEQLVSQLLTLAKLEPENHPDNKQLVDLIALAKESFEELLPLALDKSIELNLSIDGLPQVYGYKQELKILFNNVLDNAIRYSQKVSKVDVILLAQSESVCVEIIDQGPGIPELDFERVFDRFYRGESKETTGSGLGLAIAKEIALRHSAKISLTNLNPGFSLKISFEAI